MLYFLPTLYRFLKCQILRIFFSIVFTVDKCCVHHFPVSLRVFDQIDFVATPIRLLFWYVVSCCMTRTVLVFISGSIWGGLWRGGITTNGLLTEL
jgi:hypothetical protein